MVYETFSPEETYEIGRRMGSEARPGLVITLDGDLGAGKTLFTKGFAEGLGITEPVSSPTFTILQEYEGGRTATLSTEEIEGKIEEFSGGLYKKSV